MADRTVSVNFHARVAGFTSGVQKMKHDVSTMRSEVALASRTNAAEMQTVGTAAAAMGGGILLGLGASAKAAMDFESSFAGVRKTVDASESEFAALSEGFRGLSREIPISVNELNGIGESAGQLGIAKENILGFTRTMADLGVATNLTADEAATSFARFANITGMPQENFDRLGSTVVDLGNNLATTESEIAEFGLRLAGAGAQIGLSEAEILGLGGALSSLGINAEAGGTAVSKVMIDMSMAVSEGGEQLSLFADVAGMSAQAFATSFRDDPAAAIGAFVEGLGRIDQSGGDLFSTLEELGITEQRMRDAMLRTAGAGTLVADSMNMANGAFEENTALSDEAAQRYGTLESRITLAKNAIYDAGISLGETLTPALGGAADAVAGLAGGLADLPAPLQLVAGGLGGLVGTVGLAAGGFLIAAPRIVATGDALQKLATTMPRSTAALSGLKALLMGPWGIAIAAATIGVGLWAKKQGEAKAAIEEFSGSLDDQTGAITDNTRATALRRLQDEGMIEDARELGISMKDLTDAVLGEGDAMARVTDQLWEMHQGGEALGMNAVELQSMIEGFAESLGIEAEALGAAVESTRELATATAEAEGRFIDAAHATESGMTNAMYNLSAAHDNQADAAEAGVGPNEEFAGSLDTAATAAEEAAAAQQGYLDMVSRATDPVFNLMSAIEDVDAAQEEYNEAVKEYGVDSDEAADASINLMGKLGNLEAAAIDGDLSFANFSAKLDNWVAQGKITADQANAIRGRVNEARGAAEDFAGNYRAWLEATDNASNIINNVINLLGRVPTYTHSQIVVARKYTSSGGGAIAEHEGGWAGRGRKVQRRHAGGWGDPFGLGVPLAANEVPIIALRDEYVLNPADSRRFADMGLIPRLHDGGYGDTTREVGTYTMPPGAGSTAVVDNRQVTINLPPGTNGDDVVRAIRRWERDNGPAPIGRR